MCLTKGIVGDCYHKPTLHVIYSLYGRSTLGWFPCINVFLNERIHARMSYDRDVRYLRESTTGPIKLSYIWIWDRTCKHEHSHKLLSVNVRVISDYAWCWTWRILHLACVLILYIFRTMSCAYQKEFTSFVKQYLK